MINTVATVFFQGHLHRHRYLSAAIATNAFRFSSRMKARAAVITGTEDVEVRTAAPQRPAAHAARASSSCGPRDVPGFRFRGAEASPKPKSGYWHPLCTSLTWLASHQALDRVLRSAPYISPNRLQPMSDGRVARALQRVASCVSRERTRRACTPRSRAATRRGPPPGLPASRASGQCQDVHFGA